MCTCIVFWIIRIKTQQLDKISSKNHGKQLGIKRRNNRWALTYTYHRTRNEREPREIDCKREKKHTHRRSQIQMMNNTFYSFALSRGRFFGAFVFELPRVHYSNVDNFFYFRFVFFFIIHVTQCIVCAVRSWSTMKHDTCAKMRKNEMPMKNCSLGWMIFFSSLSFKRWFFCYSTYLIRLL